MPNIATVLREEITPLTQRASRIQPQKIRKFTTQHRRQIASLRHRLEEGTRNLASLERKSVSNGAGPLRPASALKVALRREGSAAAARTSRALAARSRTARDRKRAVDLSVGARRDARVPHS